MAKNIIFLITLVVVFTTLAFGVLYLGFSDSQKLENTDALLLFNSGKYGEALDSINKVLSVRKFDYDTG